MPLFNARIICYFCRSSNRLILRDGQPRRTIERGFIRGEDLRELNPIRLIEIDNARHNVTPQTLIIAFGLRRL